jgi:hypothetical protein
MGLHGTGWLRHSWYNKNGVPCIRTGTERFWRFNGIDRAFFPMWAFTAGDYAIAISE